MKMRNEEMKLSEHFTLGELTKTKVKLVNVPNEAQVENLKRLCRWLEQKQGVIWIPERRLHDSCCAGKKVMNFILKKN